MGEINGAMNEGTEYYENFDTNKPESGSISNILLIIRLCLKIK